MPETAAVTIARVLSERGYDFEIAHIFALEAWTLGRLRGAENMTEAVAVVADMLTPNGVFAHTECAPRPYTKVGRRFNSDPLDHSRRWLAT